MRVAHRLSDIDEENKTAFCSVHQRRVRIHLRNITSGGKNNWRCPPIRRRGYRAHKKDHCELCGFKGHICQLDVDHRDGNHKNNDPNNLVTLCANCHRLKTWNERQKPLPLPLFLLYY